MELHSQTSTGTPSSSSKQQKQQEEHARMRIFVMTQEVHQTPKYFSIGISLHSFFSSTSGSSISLSLSLTLSLTLCLAQNFKKRDFRHQQKLKKKNGCSHRFTKNPKLTQEFQYILYSHTVSTHIQRHRETLIKKNFKKIY